MPTVDKPGALLKDLKQRGMLENSSRMGWEFGRTPMSQVEKDMVEITIPMVLVCGWWRQYPWAMFVAQLMNLNLLQGSSSCS